jgi:lysophospholipase L1-like esterase
MNRVFRKLQIAALLILMSFVGASPDKIKIYLVGDSTIANKPLKVFPETGWGMPLQSFFDSTVVVDNRAQNGRSTRTFLQENRWQPIVDSLKEGDYVFIQFGHNDAAKDKPERYTAPEDYRKNLEKFITETRSKKAVPVLITPVARRKFDKSGRTVESHEIYAPLVREVARQFNTPLVDLDAMSRELLEKMGEENSKLLYLQLEPGDHPNYPEGKKDNTHFSELGARKMAQLVVNEIKRQNLELATRIVKVKPKS